VRRQHHERAAAITAIALPDAADWRDVRYALDEELRRLPEEHRAPLLLCDLAGQTQEQAAHALGWSFGTLRRRLEQGRSRLRQRLTQRGLAPWAAAALPVPFALSDATVRAAGPLASTASPRILALTQEGLGLMSLTRLRIGAVIVLALGSLGAGLLGRLELLAQQPNVAPPTQPGSGSLQSPRFGVATALRPPSRSNETGPTTPQPADLDQRLAEIEARLEGLTRDVKSIRQQLRKTEASAKALVLPLKHVIAAEAEKILQEVFNKNRSTRIRVMSDDATNSLIVYGVDGDLAQIQELLKKLDAPK
jgi:hypothetical protein